jgi:hypothetical protein
MILAEGAMAKVATADRDRIEALLDDRTSLQWP